MALAVTSGICAAQSATSIIPEWQALCGVALLASVAIITFLYLVNRFFQNSEGAGWAKLELYEAFVTIAIFFALIAITGLACNVRASWLFPAAAQLGDVNIFEAAASYLDQFTDNMMVIMNSLYGFYVAIDLISSMTLSGRPFGFGTTIMPSAGFASMVKPGLNNAFNMLSISYIINSVQIFLLNFISFGFLKYYLPIGLFLRSFTPTRRIGGTIIGLALGFLFVYPFLIIMEGQFFTRPLQLFSSELINFSEDISSTQVGTEFAEWWKESVYGLGIFDFANYLLRSVIGLFAFMLLYFSASAAGYAFMVGLLLPAFNTLLLVTTIRYLSKSMGEEIDVTNLTRLI